jgi:hypothetical protein
MMVRGVLTGSVLSSAEHPANAATQRAAAKICFSFIIKFLLFY